MALWYLRALERDDHQWECRFGRQELGVRPTREAAVYRLAAVATDLGGRDLFRLYLHHRDGTVEARDATDPLPGEDDEGRAQRGA